MNGINVIRYGTEIHKMRLSQEFYDLRVMSVMCHANIKARCIILLIETKLHLPSELRLRFVDVKSSRRHYICKFFNLRNGKPQGRTRNEAIRRRRLVLRSARCGSRSESNALIPMSEFPREHYCPRNCYDQSLSQLNDIKRNAATKLPHNNYRDWHRSVC